MTMHITYLRDHDGHKQDKSYYVERTLARRLCENDIALPYMVAESKKIETATLLDKVAVEKAISVAARVHMKRPKRTKKSNKKHSEV